VLAPFGEPASAVHCVSPLLGASRSTPASGAFPELPLEPELPVLFDAPLDEPELLLDEPAKEPELPLLDELTELPLVPELLALEPEPLDAPLPLAVLAPAGFASLKAFSSVWLKKQPANATAAIIVSEKVRIRSFLQPRSRRPSPMDPR